MMPCMSRFPVRVVCHAILRIDVVPARVRALETEIRRRCAESDAQLVEFCVDFGKPKRRAEDYPALNYLRSGKADALLIVGVPSDKPLPPGDLLTSRALSGFPMGWLNVPKLRELGLLPPAIGPRSLAAQRAATLRERRFPCDVIARWLDAEGYAAPNDDPGHFTRGDVLKLLREARATRPPTLPDEPQDSPAALL
ncbi:hypothetical protein BVG81_008695 [Haliangium sp. UPWRP_2]|nr:hypothetical protein BVG81_008695 [Haliangium sp. UPWRP_2]